MFDSVSLGGETKTSTRKNRTSGCLGEAMDRSRHLADAVTTGAVSADQAGPSPAPAQN